MIENKISIWINHINKKELENLIISYGKWWIVSDDEDVRLETDGLHGIEINHRYTRHPYFISFFEMILKTIRDNGYEVYFGGPKPNYYELMNQSFLCNSACQLFLYSDYTIKFKIADFENETITTYTSWADYCEKNNLKNYSETC